MSALFVMQVKEMVHGAVWEIRIRACLQARRSRPTAIPASAAAGVQSSQRLKAVGIPRVLGGIAEAMP
jgi:hypothetical protein